MMDKPNLSDQTILAAVQAAYDLPLHNCVSAWQVIAGDTLAGNIISNLFLV